MVHWGLIKGRIFYFFIFLHKSTMMVILLSGQLVKGSSFRFFHYFSDTADERSVLF